MTTPDEQTPSQWFPPERGPVVIIGYPGNLFPRHLARLWRSMGLDARIVTRRWEGPAVLPDGTSVLSVEHRERRFDAALCRATETVSWAVEASVVRLQRERYARAMGSETSYRPYVSPRVADAWAIARVVRQEKPQFVCGQEVFAYGLATALCGPRPKILMPWGGDVYMYAKTSSLAFATVRYALRHVDLVAPGSPLSGAYLTETFGVQPERMHWGGLWALDRDRFRRATNLRRTEIRRRFGIDPNALVVMNIRRFFPAWGSDVVLATFCRIAGHQPSAHFVMLGGSGTEALVADARQVLDARGLAKRFTLFDGDVPFETYADLISIADIGVSMMREHDMRPLASILEAASCQVALVLSDQPEYRAMERLGFRATFCAADEECVGHAIGKLAVDRDWREAMAGDNLTYLDAHEDGRSQAMALLERVRALRP